MPHVERRIRAMNPHALIHRTERCAIPLDRVLDRGAFDLDRILTLEPEFLDGDDHDHHDHDHHDHDHDHDHHHHHHDIEGSGVFSISLRGGDLDPQKFFPWIQQTAQEQGPDILRLKGILAFKDDAGALRRAGRPHDHRGQPPARLEGRREAREPAGLHRPPSRREGDQGRFREVPGLRRDALPSIQDFPFGAFVVEAAFLGDTARLCAGRRHGAPRLRPGGGRDARP